MNYLTHGVVAIINEKCYAT